MMAFGKSRFFLAATLAAASVVCADRLAAQESACTEGSSPGTPCTLEAWQTVEIEHQFRLQRLKRLSEGKAEFEYSAAEIPQDLHGIEDFPADIPVLRVVAKSDVFFDTDSTEIREEALPFLDIIAENLRLEPPDVALFIAGHTDWRGSADYNMELGQKRAQSVAEALVRRGIYQARIFAVSFGEHMPIADNETKEGEARNRRVEFLFGAQQKAVVTVLEKQAVMLCPKSECGKQIRFVAQEVVVPLEHRKKVLELAERYKSVSLDTDLTPVEMAEKKKVIELERKTIPVVLERKRIYIELK